MLWPYAAEKPPFFWMAELPGQLFTCKVFLKVKEKKGTLFTKWIVPLIAWCWLGREFLCFQPKQRKSSRAAHPELKLIEAWSNSLPCWLHGVRSMLSTWYFLTTQLKYLMDLTHAWYQIRETPGYCRVLMLPCRTSLSSALRMCISSRSMGQILLPQGQGSFLGSHTQKWSKAAAVTLRKCSPHPPHHQHTLPVGRHRGTSLQTPSCCSLLQWPPSLWAHLRRSVVPCCHSTGLPYPWREPQCNSHGTYDTLSQLRALPALEQSPAEQQSSPFGSFCLWQQTLMISILCAQVDGKGKSLSNSSPGNETSYLVYEQVHHLGLLKFQQ